MKLLVIGSGGREHAMAWRLAQSTRVQKVYVAPGNGGTASIAENVSGLNAEDGQAVLAFVQDKDIDLVVIGPEAPLVAGVADVLRAAGVPVSDTIPMCPDAGFDSGIRLVRRWAHLMTRDIKGDWGDDERLFRDLIA